MIQISSEQQVLQEGFQILLSTMEPSKFARFCAAWGSSSSDYLKTKDELFAQESVNSLYAKISDFQASKPES
ncbi:hypothetical protein C8255_14150 [filamentous cyanobacterium CCP3]|nr:hypothetical protein C8255_14150 [filamentous cyanobacterium CCP3]